jgi:hypothetical protein
VRAARQQNFPKLRDAAGDARFDRADGHFENFGDVFVGVVFQVEERYGGLKDLVHFGQRGQHLGIVRLMGAFGGNNRQFVRDLIQILVGKPHLPSACVEESAVQRREQPGLDLGNVAQLMSLLGPDVEGLLGQIPGIRFHAREAQCEPEKRLVVLVHNCFKLIDCFHDFFGSVVPLNPKLLFKTQGMDHCRSILGLEWEDPPGLPRGKPSGAAGRGDAIQVRETVPR